MPRKNRRAVMLLITESCGYPISQPWMSNDQVSPPYMSANWPMRYASLSTDGKLVAIAGRRGLTHYSVASGKWKLYTDARQEQDFTVRGGMLWFHHVLVVAVDVDKGHQVCDPQYHAS